MIEKEYYWMQVNSIGELTSPYYYGPHLNPIPFDDFYNEDDAIIYLENLYLNKKIPKNLKFVLMTRYGWSQ